ncbi:MAG TPA: hypothetical protein V6D10_10925 [Trichocoleus sp.]
MRWIPSQEGVGSSSLSNFSSLNQDAAQETDSAMAGLRLNVRDITKSEPSSLDEFYAFITIEPFQQSASLQIKPVMRFTRLPQYSIQKFKCRLPPCHQTKPIAFQSCINAKF